MSKWKEGSTGWIKFKYQLEVLRFCSAITSCLNTTTTKNAPKKEKHVKSDYKPPPLFVDLGCLSIYITIFRLQFGIMGNELPRSHQMKRQIRAKWKARDAAVYSWVELLNMGKQMLFTPGTSRKENLARGQRTGISDPLWLVLRIYSHISGQRKQHHASLRIWNISHLNEQICAFRTWKDA